MDAFIFRAALWCSTCAESYMADNPRPAHVDPDDESSYDSGEWPKGPYGQGGGETDTPQHCEGCQVFLRNPLTCDGVAYVREAAAALRPGPAVAEWKEFYGL